MADIPGNRNGFDATDALVASTVSGVTSGGNNFYENVGLLDFSLPAYTGTDDFNPDAGDYYVSVQDLGNTSVTFGIAASVPEPALFALIVLVPLLSARRRARRV